MVFLGRLRVEFGYNQELDELQKFEGSKLTSKKASLVKEAKIVEDLAHDNWKHYYAIFHKQQPDNAKNYLWLAVTMITALFALKSFWEILTWLQSCLLIITFSLSILCILIGITCLSSAWFYGDEPDEPVGSCSTIQARTEAYGVKSEERYGDLKYIIQQYDKAIAVIRARIVSRAKRLRLMSYSIFSAMLSGSFLFVLIFFGGVYP